MSEKAIRQLKKCPYCGKEYEGYPLYQEKTTKPLYAPTVERERH